MELPRPWACLVGAVVALAFSLGCFSAVAVAAVYEPPADPSEPELPAELPACPVGAEPYEGENEVVAELRRLRVEASEACASTNARLGLLRERLFWVVQEQVAAAGQRQLTNEKLTALVGSLDGEPPLPVADTTAEEQSADVVAAVDASGLAIKEALWFLAGAGVALLGGYGLYRQVMPRG